MRYFLHRKSNRKTGFTLVELLVVIGIIALLISILLPSLSKAKKSALKVKCAANLHNLGLSLQTYCSENRGKLPNLLDLATVAPGAWLWDYPIVDRDPLVATGAARATLYCPFFPAQDQDGLWNYNASYSVLGYFMLIDRGGKKPNGYPTLTARAYQKTLALPEPVPNLDPVSSAEIELVTDAVLSQGGLFGGIKGGFAMPHQTSHRGTNGKPEGGNILFMDGHADWRGFDKMQVRAVLGATSFWF